MWDNNAPLQLLKTMPKKLNQENLEKIQLLIDADKYKNSIISGFDLCGIFAPFCRGCDKTSIYPCAVSYIRMLQAQGMTIEIDASPMNGYEQQSYTPTIEIPHTKPVAPSQRPCERKPQKPRGYEQKYTETKRIEPKQPERKYSEQKYAVKNYEPKVQETATEEIAVAQLEPTKDVIIPVPVVEEVKVEEINVNNTEVLNSPKQVPETEAPVHEEESVKAESVTAEVNPEQTRRKLRIAVARRKL